MQVNLIDRESIHQLELNISESIIENYEDLKKNISRAREKYIK
jgi:midasin (ATPase involved in ribosome maturation)